MSIYSDWANANCDPDDDDYIPSCAGKTVRNYMCQSPATMYFEGYCYCKRHAPEGAEKLNNAPKAQKGKSK